MPSDVNADEGDVNIVCAIAGAVKATAMGSDDILWVS
jgi:hypothetical protein